MIQLYNNWQSTDIIYWHISITYKQAPFFANQWTGLYVIETCITKELRNKNVQENQK